MNKSTRRLGRCGSIFAGVIATALLLGACSSGGSPAAESPKSLTMWTFKQSHLDALKKAAVAFKKKTGISVNIQAITPDDAYSTRIQSAAQTGDLPDVLEVNSDGADRVFGGSGVTVDLTGLLPKGMSKNYVSSMADSGIITTAQYKKSQLNGANDVGIEVGKRYSVPFTIGAFGIVYGNKAKLAAAGVTGAPATWEDFISDAKATVAKDPKAGGISVGFQSVSVGINWVLDPLAYATVGDAKFKALFGSSVATDWSSPAGSAALSKYNALSGLWMPGTQSVSINDADLAFVNGRSAFDFGGTFTLAFLKQNGMDLDNVIAFPIPAPADGAVKDLRLAPIGLTSLAITKDAKNSAGAATWLEYLSDPKVATQFATDAVDFPATDLGAASASVLGPILSSLTPVFTGDKAQLFDAGSLAEYTAPGLDFDKLGALVAKMSPLGETNVAQTGRAMSALQQAFYAAAK